MSLRWTLRSRRDLIDIAAYVARDNLAAARRLVRRIRQKARQAAEYPRSGRVVPELGRQDVRDVLMFPYRIVYRVHENAVDVLTVFEGHRAFPLQSSEDEETN